MSQASSTTDVAMINLVMLAADGSGGVWQDPVQLIPHGMNSDPEGFVARIREGLPLVNNLRVLFNEHSFNPDGSLHPEMERFLRAAVAQEFELTICYGGGDAQNIGIGTDGQPIGFDGETATRIAREAIAAAYGTERPAKSTMKFMRNALHLVEVSGILEHPPTRQTLVESGWVDA